MNYRCPACRVDLAGRRKSQAVITRMEIDCPQCKSRIRLNVHRAEVVLVLLSFGSIAVLATLAYWLKSETLALLIFCAAMAGALALPLVERTLLRDWPRYTRVTRDPHP